MTRLLMRPSGAALAVWSLAALLIAGIVHLASVLLMPTVASNDAYARLSTHTIAPGFNDISIVLGDGALPFLDTAVELRACRYDLRVAPYRLRIDIDAEALTTMSFHSRTGIVFHTLTDRAALRGRLSVLVGTPAQIEAVEAADVDDTQTEEVRLVSPSTTGIILLRAMAPTDAGREALRRRLAKSVCAAAS